MAILADEPPFDADERTMALGWLDHHRAAVLRKIDGLDDEQLRRRLVGSRTTLLGLVKHLAFVERSWFRVVFAGEAVPDDPGFADDPDFDFEPAESTDEIVALYRDECDRSRAICAAGRLDDRARAPQVAERGPDVNLRWIVTHMIEETARHNGQADILRELIDGATGD